MIFSLFVFCYPGAVGPLTFDGGDNLYPIIDNEKFQPVAGFKGRKILSTEFGTVILLKNQLNEFQSTKLQMRPNIHHPTPFLKFKKH